MISGEMGTLGEDERCHRCGGENVTWSAPSPLWNLVMRGNDIDGDPKWGDLVCIRCFIVLAEKIGVRGRWRVSADPEPEGLVKVTPSGRVWNDEKWLWGQPPLADDEEMCIDCFAGMDSDQHREACLLGRGPWPGREHRVMDYRARAEVLRQTANIMEADRCPQVAQKSRDRAYALLHMAEALERPPLVAT